MARPPAGPAILALCIGVISGTLAFLAGMPLPWMLGPMIGTTLAALAGLPIAGPDRVRPYMIPVIGVMLGSAITPEIWEQLGQWAVTMLILPVFLGLSAAVSFAVYRKVGGYDHVTAYYAAMPGGLNEMLILGEAEGGNGRQIAIAHAARVLFVIFFVALFFGFYLGVTTGASSTAWLPFDALTMQDYLILGTCAVLGVPLAKLFHFPAPSVFGPMVLSGIAHLVGWVVVAPPSIVVIAAQIVMGSVIGSRFIGVTLAQLRRDIGLAVLATLGMLGVAIGFAECVAILTGMPLSQAFLAYSPGGLTEMSLLTLAMDQDVAFVSITHIVRITFVIAIAPGVFFLLLQPRKR